MAGAVPTFITGANAKVKVNNVTLAFCTNVSYVISIAHATPTVLGMYEGSSVEPLSYKVSGSFTVIRYVADAVNEKNLPKGAVPQGNGIGNWSRKNGAINRLGDLTDGRAYDNLNPGKLDKACGFDIEILQKKNNANEGTSHLAKIRNCRITQASLQVGVKSTANQVFNFVALYVDEDSFLADFSGSGQQFA